ncbi:hypothetical protein D3C81_792940 [compost metagenome]
MDRRAGCDRVITGIREIGHLQIHGCQCSRRQQSGQRQHGGQQHPSRQASPQPQPLPLRHRGSVDVLVLLELVAHWITPLQTRCYAGLPVQLATRARRDWLEDEPPQTGRQNESPFRDVEKARILTLAFEGYSAGF